MKSFEVQSKKRVEAIDITPQVNKAIKEDGIEQGVAFVYVPHCTACLIVNEFEPNIKEDYEKLFSELEKRDWKHNIIDDNAAAHLGSALAGTSRFFFVERGSLVLGTWQRVILVELDGPRKRSVFLRTLRF